MTEFARPTPFNENALGTEHAGLAKIRLVHGRSKSLFLVDALVVETDTYSFWLQPQWQYGHQISFFEDDAVATLYLTAVDRHGTDVPLEVEIWSSEKVRALPDRSEIYRAVIRGPEQLSRLRAGLARVRPDQGLDLRLFHHTTPRSKIAIIQSKEVWGSPWNFAGTRRLVNNSYAYFTNLPSIDTEEHLTKIAMASTGRLAFVLDQNTVADRPDVIIDVYRGSTHDRTATVPL